MESPQGSYRPHLALFERLGQLLGMKVEPVQRRTYREINDLLAAGQIDVALVCTGGYLKLERQSPGAVELLAVPVIGGKTTYHALIVVPTSSPASGLGDLRGKRFAFTDEFSLSGYLYPASLVRDLDHGTAPFFGATIFTHGHDRSIETVSKGLVDGAAVDSLVYERLVATHSRVAAGTRVLHRSPPFGSSPVVASTRIPAALRVRIRQVVLALDRDDQAALALRGLGVEKFVEPSEGLYSDAGGIAGSGE